jgi:hypothetical protein
MTVLEWDADQAITRGPLDEDLDGYPAIDRYGISQDEEIAGEPLAVALAQEEPEFVVDDPTDDQWALVDQPWDVADRLFGTALADAGPEVAALHLEVL